MSISLDFLLQKVGFTPNLVQYEAIKHIDGPLFLAAGPGSGKTRVLLWRTVNLIVFENVRPEEIFLSTFTEKAALQLKQGLITLLGMVTNETGQNFDLSPMYIGTVHSLCQRLLNDRRFFTGDRKRSPIILDELDQFIHLQQNSFWNLISAHFNISPNDLYSRINHYISGTQSESKFAAVQNCIKLFNRCSEESITPDALGTSNDDTMQILAYIYEQYIQSLNAGRRKKVDFSLLQQEAVQCLQESPQASGIFRHIIIDEYQDTNSVQEKIFFKLTEESKNICVVGDDDQALYRFRGATVENFVRFPERGREVLNQSPKKLTLNINYRSRKQIVDFYNRFIDMEDWSHAHKEDAYYRVMDKNIEAYSNDEGPSVVVARTASSDDVYSEIADYVHRIIIAGKVSDPNQIAFLFPSLKSVHVERMKAALEQEGLRVYAPRAGKFLELEEPSTIIGLLIHIFGKPDRHPLYDRGENRNFHDWLDRCAMLAGEIISTDAALLHFVNDKKEELAEAIQNYAVLMQTISDNGITLTDPFSLDEHRRILASTPGISGVVKKDLLSKRMEASVKLRLEGPRPLTVKQVINRVTTLDWNLLDLFYRFCGFNQLKACFDLAEHGVDEGPICNLSMMSQYLSRFVDQYYSLIGGAQLVDDQFQRVFFNSYLGALFRRGESEYEDAEDPFPKGRIPFLTIHQSKGLEFPVVVLGNPGRAKNQPQTIETLVRPFLSGDLEPLPRTSLYDAMRMYYVALSRAQNLLIVPHYHGRGKTQHYNTHIHEMLQAQTLPLLADVNIDTISNHDAHDSESYRVYSYTSDFLSYKDCPRKYMIFRKYGFAPARSTTMFFGQLVHKTLEDLHLSLIEERKLKINDNR